MSETPPALSESEWAKHLDGSAAIKRSGEMEIALGVYASISGDERWRENDSLNYGTMPPFLILYWQTVNDHMAVHDPHKLAALCLHGQPFGFTRKDVENLRLWACDFPYDVDDIARDLASRIEALLPPDLTP